MNHQEYDRVLITGASGFIGSAIVRVFLDAGYEVRVLVRSASPRTNFASLPVEIAVGDLADKRSIAAALKDVRYLVHTAADYRLWTRKPSELISANVQGTRTIMEEAKKSGVEKIVYTSSVCTLAHASPTDPADEQHSHDGDDAFNPYKRSKILAEDVVRDLIARSALPAVIVNPSAPVGPRDIKPTPTGRIIVECAAGRMPAYVDTGLNLVHVDDVAQGHLAALKHGVVGERYILGGQNIRLRDMLAEIARQTGRQPPRVKLPVPVVIPFAIASEAVAWCTGKEPFATRDGLRMARQCMFFNDAKARRELRYTSRPYEEGISDALAWFYSAGMLARPRGELRRGFRLMAR